MKFPATFELYVDYLIANQGRVSAVDLSAIVQGERSHDHITRTIAQPILDQKTFWKLVKPVIRQVERDDGCIAVDDFIVEKPHSTPNEIIGTYYSHLQGDYVQGINILHFLYLATGEYEQSLQVPVAFEILRKSEAYVDAKSGKSKMRSPQTKNELMRERLQTLVFHNQVAFRYVLWDTWFSAAENMRFVVKDLQKHFVGALKSNRKVALVDAQGQKTAYQSLSTLDLQPSQVYPVRLESVPFDLFLIKVVYKNLDGSQGVVFLVTSDEGLDAQQILLCYQKRWKVEEAHKSLKQNLGIAKACLKMDTSQCNHVFAAMCGLFQLEKLKIKLKTNHFALKHRIYLAALQAAWDKLAQLKGHSVNELNFQNLCTA